MKYFKITRTWLVKAGDEAEAFRLIATDPNEHLESEAVTRVRTPYMREQFPGSTLVMFNNSGHSAALGGVGEVQRRAGPVRRRPRRPAGYPAGGQRARRPTRCTRPDVGAAK